MSETQTITREFTEPVTFGDQNMVLNSTFNEGVNMGADASIHNCYINGPVEVTGNYVTFTGCVVYGNNEHGIRVTGDNQVFGNNRNIKPKFTEEVTKTAWKLLEGYMTPPQYFAFMEGSKIEVENNTGKFRLLIGKNGDFHILEGKKGEGIMATTGRIRSHDYPLGDEIATFMDWFKFKTEELISQWNCGTYGIVKEGQRR